MLRSNELRKVQDRLAQIERTEGPGAAAPLREDAALRLIKATLAAGPTGRLGAPVTPLGPSSRSIASSNAPDALRKAPR